MSLFDDSLLAEVPDPLTAQRRAANLARRANHALADLHIASHQEALFRPSEGGAYVVLRLPVDRAERLITDLELVAEDIRWERGSGDGR